MVRRIVAVGLLAAMFGTTGCFTHKYTVGDGPRSNIVNEERQWFALWGLVPITTVDTKAMIGDATNYSVKSEFTPIDVIIGIVTGIVTVQPRTIEVRK